MGKAITFIILAAAGIYLLLLYQPGLYFNKKVEYEMFTLHARGSLPEDYERVLDDARDRMKSSPMFRESMKMDIYLPSTSGEYSLFTPWAREGEYFRHSYLGGMIFLAAADFADREARTAPGADDARGLSGVIAGAGAFEITRMKLKPLTYISMHEWKVRGYAEIMSGGAGWFNISDACSHDDRTGLTDYRYGRILEQMLKQEDLPYEEILGRNISYKVAERRFRQDSCGG